MREGGKNFVTRMERKKLRRDERRANIEIAIAIAGFLLQVLAFFLK